jgi:prophage tail gpP-like protein
MLQGVGVQFYAARASVIHPTGNFDGKNLQQVANEVAAPTGVAFLPIGNVDPTPFKQLQVGIGEPIGHFIERLARPRGVILGSDHHGNLLLIGDHSEPAVAELVEGINILKCQALISEAEIYSKYLVHGQTGASNDNSGPTASEMDAEAMGALRRYSPILTPAEQPVWSKAELQKRAQNEAKWHNGTIIRVHITVQGWMMPGRLMKGAAPNPRTHDLWRAGSLVSVYSPMAMLDMYMAIKTATFTQDSKSGTLTELELVPPWALNDGNDLDVTNPTAPQPTTVAPTPLPPTTTPPDKLPSTD